MIAVLGPNSAGKTTLSGSLRAGCSRPPPERSCWAGRDPDAALRARQARAVPHRRAAASTRR